MDDIIYIDKNINEYDKDNLLINKENLTVFGDDYKLYNSVDLSKILMLSIIDQVIKLHEYFMLIRGFMGVKTIGTRLKRAWIMMIFLKTFTCLMRNSMITQFINSYHLIV